MATSGWFLFYSLKDSVLNITRKQVVLFVFKHLNMGISFLFWSLCLKTLRILTQDVTKMQVLKKQSSAERKSV